MTFRVRKVAEALRAPEPRIAASIAHQGLAARLWSVALGSAVLYGRIPDLSPHRLRWDPDASAPDDLWLDGVEALPGDAGTVAEAVLDRHLEPLAALLHAEYRLATGLLWGNAGSALTGAARQLLERRPDVSAPVRDLTAGLLAHPLLHRALDGTTLRRRSCCLYYRLPEGGVCGDCCFTRAPRSSPRGASG